MSQFSQLNHRAKRILYAAVTEYISTGDAVSSRRLAKTYQLNLSPATIRTVLSDLEEDGLLFQPHTSAGRIPTEAGLRLFVDALVQVKDVSATDRRAVIERLKCANSSGELLHEASEILSNLTGVATLIAAPRPDQEKLAQLRYMPFRNNQLLAIIVTSSGVVQNRVVQSTQTPNESLLERLNNYLDELLSSGPSLRDLHAMLIRETQDQRSRYHELSKYTKDVLNATVQPSGDSDVTITGQSRLFDRPEFVDVDKIRNYLRAFEDREQLTALLGETISAGGVRVVIGSEAHLSDVEDVSVISASYGPDSSAGSLGVIGPTRMDYAKVVPLVGFTANLVTKILSDESDDGDIGLDSRQNEPKTKPTDG